MLDLSANKMIKQCVEEESDYYRKCLKLVKKEIQEQQSRPTRCLLELYPIGLLNNAVFDNVHIASGYTYPRGRLESSEHVDVRDGRI